MASNAILLITLALLNFICISFAFDPRPLQDFCVADPPGNATCKDPKAVTANDFFLSGLDRPGPFNAYGVAFVLASANTVPGFNTLGLTLGRAEFAPNGYLPPHIHPTSSEVIYVAEGILEVGFVTTYPQYKYYSKVLNKGDVFIIPVGLLHIQRNVARTKTVILAAFNTQNRRIIYIPDSAFAAKPAINSLYLAAAFKLNENTVKDLQTKQWEGRFYRALLILFKIL
ncbi:germin-like protein subfamily 1 member 11 [Salvia miltiorrhiza]|uniref:germin-like protein subfamily 1 member 11 n=1 Tax=Salvia miltiorrhiza TaxID=226208 RepID=UPI0025AD9353|nr:germin-like protein subfamily 1 member 11 [Salvia miltiorrhiza]